MSENEWYTPYSGPVSLRDPRPVVLVYCIGKVASKTIVETLYPFSQYRVFHIQRLNPVDQCEQHATYAGASEDIRMITSFNEELKSFIDRCFFSHRWFVITIVRDPVAIALSAFFELWNAGMFNTYSPQSAAMLRSIGDNSDALLRFAENEFSWDPIKDYITNWFDRELRVTFAIDLGQSVFDHTKKYSIINASNVSLLAFRLEDIDGMYKNALKEFLDLDVPALTLSNCAKDKSYYPTYALFKQRFRPKPAIVDRLYSVAWVKWFYTEDEIAGFREYWGKNDR